MKTSHQIWIACGSLVVVLGCTTGPLPAEEFAIDRTAAEESAPLGGDSLVQRKAEMRRSLHDLMHLHRTLSSLADRQDRTGFLSFADFLDSYLGTHVDPMLSGHWQSRHPEVMALDANIRLMKAIRSFIL